MEYWYKFPGDYNISCNLIGSTQLDSQVIGTGWPVSITFFQTAGLLYERRHREILGWIAYNKEEKNIKKGKYLTENRKVFSTLSQCVHSNSLSRSNEYIGVNLNGFF